MFLETQKLKDKRDHGEHLIEFLHFMDENTLAKEGKLAVQSHNPKPEFSLLSSGFMFTSQKKQHITFCFSS